MFIVVRLNFFYLNSYQEARAAAVRFTLISLPLPEAGFGTFYL